MRPTLGERRPHIGKSFYLMHIALVTYDVLVGEMTWTRQAFVPNGPFLMMFALM